MSCIVRDEEPTTQIPGAKTFQADGQGSKNLLDTSQIDTSALAALPTAL